MPSKVVNVVVAGLGGQGVVKASNILTSAVFRAGYDVKKSEIHGMSQRGGSVMSDVRFGEKVLSPMIPRGKADFLLVIEESQVEVNRVHLKPGGILISPSKVYKEEREEALREQRALNVGLLGALSAHLDIPEEAWREAIRENLPERAHELNLRVFAEGRATERMMRAVTQWGAKGD